ISRRGLNPRGRNKRCVWTIPVRGFRGQHFATFPEQLIETPILAGCPEGGIVCDPFFGTGTSGLVAQKLRRRFLGIELNPRYVRLARNRLAGNHRKYD
ncbi:MAG TPA: site-specific DNA-methyltransferase, partial [Cyclobacteriaceae bacterium]|nr:site-specific DNA-methyltransferase [Cyclobacteriaceae bacterium]